VWLIDHGAGLYFHHAWTSADKLISRPYDASDHVLATFVDDAGLADAGRALAPKVTEDLLREVVALVPEEWLADEPGFGSPVQVADAYVAHLRTRVTTQNAWLPQVGEARPAVPRAEQRASARPKWLR
ncbi:MAG: aminotransferase class I and II, partial [Actinoallomurus sp.]